MTVFDYIKDIFVNPARYRKFWIGIAGATVTYLTAKLGAIPEITLLTGYLTAGGIFGVPNER